MKATASTMAHITIADPRSPWARQAAAARPATSDDRPQASADVGEDVLPAGQQVGGEQDESQLEELRRLQAEDAEGTHAWASLTVAPTPGRNGSAIPAPASTSRGMASRRTQTRCMRMPDEQPDETDAAHDHLAVEDVVRAVALGRLDRADADSTMTRPSMTNTATTTPIT